MPVVRDEVDVRSEAYVANRSHLLALLAEHDEQLALANAGGGEKYVARHRSRGKMLVRERIEYLLDPDAPFLELSPLAAWGTDFPVGAGVVTGIGVVEGVECVVSGNDATVRGGTSGPAGVRKSLRALEIAIENRLPFISLTESGGADLPHQSDIFIPGGQTFADLTRLSAMGVPTLSIVFGSSTAGGAYQPGMSDYVVMIDQRSKVFLGGPPLVKMATGEESDDESLGGAGMHARVSGLADFFATDEVDGLRLGRQVIRRLNHRKLGPGPSGAARPPRLDPEQILGIVSADLRVPFDPRQIIGRVVDDSDFDEFKPLYGPSLVTGFAEIHGFPVGILANHRGVLFNEEAEKAAQFIQLANQIDTPLVFLQNTTGYMVGKEYEQRGIVKDGSKMINAVTNSSVPHLTINMAASYGAGNYGMCGQAYGPRLLFTWPNAKTAVMGPQQLAGVMSIVARQSAASMGREFDEEADAAMRAAVEDQIERESLAPFMSGKLYDDGIVDPRDTRTILGFGLSVAHNNEVRGRRGDGFGVFRM
ncbi:MAG: carboxyl transferase domain-containing protein [Ilumatobacteraceae bacterium]